MALHGCILSEIQVKGTFPFVIMPDVSSVVIFSSLIFHATLSSRGKEFVHVLSFGLQLEPDYHLL